MTEMGANAWQALRADPLPWLLADGAPNLKWRVLVELVGRPPNSPAVERARQGASAVEPVATLLRDLRPEGSWATTHARWTPYSGPGWRLVTAVAWGADPKDPRLQAAADELLESDSGDGGFTQRKGESPTPWITARALQALAGLGWIRHSRADEALAWLEEPSVDWSDRPVVTAVGVLSALAESGERRRANLFDRATTVLMDALTAGIDGGLGYPGLGRTDSAEALAALARASAPYDRVLRPALLRLQSAQGVGGRWRRQRAVPKSLPIDSPPVGAPSRWVTLEAAVAVLYFAEKADLPRLFPSPPAEV